MDNSEKPICKDCKYHKEVTFDSYPSGFPEEYHWCLHPSVSTIKGNVVTGYISSEDSCEDVRADNLKCGLNANFFEYSKWAKLKIKIKEVFTFG